jgi:hypothetical protein
MKHPSTSVEADSSRAIKLVPAAKFSSLRALAWSGNTLYASRGYDLLRAVIGSGEVYWTLVACHRPAWWRELSAKTSLTFRLCRDGFHALAVLDSGSLVAAVPKAIVTLAPGENNFLVTHRVVRGTRPLHFAVTPSGHIFWGEYFSNPQRESVHIYVSTDQGASWCVAYTFPPGMIRHVHNILYDRWGDCLWILTGDEGDECRILRAPCDLNAVDVVLSGNQQARAVALVPTANGLYFSSDTPFESNYVYRLDRQGNLAKLAALNSSSIYGCAVGEALFFSTMAEPSQVNRERSVCVYASRSGAAWERALRWGKDRWAMKWFQFGNAAFPDGTNTSDFLAVSTVGTETGDLETGLWRVS